MDRFDDVETRIVEEPPEPPRRTPPRRLGPAVLAVVAVAALREEYDPSYGPVRRRRDPDRGGAPRASAAHAAAPARPRCARRRGGRSADGLPCRRRVSAGEHCPGADPFGRDVQDGERAPWAVPQG